VHPRRLAVLTLGIHADEEFSEVAAFQHADEGFGRVLQAVHDVFTIADVAVRFLTPFIQFSTSTVDSTDQ